MHDSINSRLDEESVHIVPTADRYEDPEADIGIDGYFVDAAISHRDEFGVSLSVHHRAGFTRTNLSRSQAVQLRDALNKLLAV